MTSQNSEQVEDQKVFTFDDFKYFWTPQGVPCFIALDEDAGGYDYCDVIETDLGLSMYYLITDKLTFKEVTETIPGHYEEPGKKWVAQSTKKTVVSERSPAIFKVVKNLVGRTVSLSTDDFGSTYVGMEEEATYQLPFIPRTLVDKMDEFFRLVHAQHGTESILLLTFDESNPNSSDSWGVLVPKQENTSVHCKYDPDSVAELKPFHLSIVGSVHSHPDMPAYASGTDHEDQADFDGLHITYGWQKSVNGGATQYYIEMQMAGKAYKLSPEDVFQPHNIVKDPDPEVVKWTENVSKKVTPPYTGGSVSQADLKVPAALQDNRPQGSTTTTREYTATGRSTYVSDAKSDRYREDLKAKLPDFDLGKNAVLVTEIDNLKDPHCVVCETMLDNYDIYDAHYCSGCGVYLATYNDTVSDILEFVTQIEYENYVSTSSDLDDIYFYCKDNNNDPVFMHIFSSDSSSKTNYTPEDKFETYLDENNDTMSYIENPSWTLCCGTYIDQETKRADECECKATVTVDDLYDFENAYPQLDFYAETSTCWDCKNYLQPTCPAYKQMIISWVSDATDPVPTSIQPCDLLDAYNYNTEYIYEKD